MILTADLAESLEFDFSYLDQPALSMALAWTPVFLQLQIQSSGLLSYFYDTPLLNFEGKLGKCLAVCDFRSPSFSFSLRIIPRVAPFKMTIQQFLSPCVPTRHARGGAVYLNNFDAM